MKRKLIVGIILITMVLPMFLNFSKVQAFSGELDPGNYITLPNTIYISNGIGTGTIDLSSSASGYTISYQKIDIDKNKFDSIQNKINELKNCIEDSTSALEEKEANITRLQSELYSLIPDYTSSWTTTTNSSDNLSLDFEDYLGTVYFVLWAKISNETNTYYDMEVYSSTIENEESITISKTSENIKVDETLQLTATSSTNSNITWTSSDNTVATVSNDGLVKGIKEGTAVITAKGNDKTATCTITVSSKTSTETNDVGWTDFSNAKFELKKNGVSGANLEISNVMPQEMHAYYLLVTSNSSKPDITNYDNKEEFILSYDEDKKCFIVDGLAKFVELNQDIYVSILEKQFDANNIENVVIHGKKIEKYEEPKYSNAFHATFMTNEIDQIVTVFTHAQENNRKIQIKIGKITDVSILQKLKEQDSSGFPDLLSFAKSNNGIYDEILWADKDDWYAIGYNAGKTATTGNSVIDLNNLQDDGYYFLYVKTDDENGKYVSNEAVTLAQAGVRGENDWSLFFYGTDDFEWADFGNGESGDPTQAPDQLPQTGIGKYIAIISVLSIVVIASYIQVKKLRDIK